MSKEALQDLWISPFASVVVQRSEGGQVWQEGSHSHQLPIYLLTPTVDQSHIPTGKVAYGRE